MQYDYEKYKLLDAVDRFFGINELKVQTTQKEGESEQWFEIRKQAELQTLKAQKRGELYTELSSLQLMLCGGSVLSTFTSSSINDLDFYIKDVSKLNEIKVFFKKYFGEQVFASTNALTFKRKAASSNKKYTVQLITKFTGAAEDVFKTFDFTITCAAYDFQNELFVFGDRFFADVSKRKLVYLGGSRYPICAMYRTKKYQDRGYSLSGATVMHISLSIVRLEIRTYGDLKEQLMGIDTMYLQGLLAEDKYADDLPVDYGVFLEEAFERIEGMIDRENEEHNE